MFSLDGKLKFIHIDQAYLKFLHEVCDEIYYKPMGYDSKPYIGILLEENGTKYVIPLSSAKEKHKSWHNVEADRFLIYENCDKKQLSPKAIFTENKDGSVKHILSVIDLKKMFPVKDGVYSAVDLVANADDTNEIKNYKNLLNKEYAFCLKIMDSILRKASKLYDKQKETGKVIKFCADFSLLEKRCEEFGE